MYHECFLAWQIQTVITANLLTRCKHEVAVDVLIAKEYFLDDDALEFGDFLQNKAIRFHCIVRLSEKQIHTVHRVRF